MAKNYRYEFAVSGNNPFPLDMLRYDCCWPRSSADVSKLSQAANNRTGSGIIEVTLVGTKEPTVERWRSFGWHVTGAYGAFRRSEVS